MENINVHPNPFNDTVEINTGVERSFTLVISNLAGDVIYLHTFPNGRSTINLESIPVGTYFFKVISNGKTLKRRIIKI